MFLVISGISSSGKTTVGKRLSEQLNCKFIDIDSFYLPNKPIVTLSNGSKVKNWDCLEALDIEALKIVIMNNYRQGLVLVGFAIRDDILPIKPTYHIHLSIGTTRDVIIKRCISGRKQSKGFTGDKEEVDRLIVEEMVYPFYIETLSKSTIDYFIEVYNNSGDFLVLGRGNLHQDNDDRRNVDDILSDIISYTERHLENEK